MQIPPNKSFPLIWKSSDPSDTGTNYVQAVIKDALTLATLKTVNLTDNGNQLFSATYTTPNDPSQTGTGRWIIITITCYTNSGYTTKNPNYSIISDTYLVKTFLDAQQVFGGGSSIDETIVRKLLEEYLGKKTNLEPIVDTPQIDYLPAISELKKEIQAIGEKVSAIQFPAPVPFPDIPKTDLAPLGSAFQTGIEKILRKIHLLPVGPNYDEAVSQLTALTDIQTSLRETFQSEVDNGKTALEQYKTMLSVLDEKTVALLSVLEYLKKMSTDNSKDTGAIADAIKIMNTVKRQRIPYKI